MDRLISASEANQRFSELLREVAGGDSFTVTSRGRPVARMIPVGPENRAHAIARLLARARERPIRYSGPWTRDDLYE